MDSGLGAGPGFDVGGPVRANEKPLPIWGRLPGQGRWADVGPVAAALDSRGGGARRAKHGGRAVGPGPNEKPLPICPDCRAGPFAGAGLVRAVASNATGSGGGPVSGTARKCHPPDNGSHAQGFRPVPAFWPDSGGVSSATTITGSTAGWPGREPLRATWSARSPTINSSGDLVMAGNAEPGAISIDWEEDICSQFYVVDAGANFEHTILRRLPSNREYTEQGNEIVRWPGPEQRGVRGAGGAVGDANRGVVAGGVAPGRDLGRLVPPPTGAVRGPRGCELTRWADSPQIEVDDDR